jgi:hypothetical protein
MRRMAAVVALSIFVLVPATAVAKGPEANCPNASSGYFVADKELWWRNTVDGFVAEGIDVYTNPNTTDWDAGFTQEFEDFSVDAGFGSAYGLYYFVWYTQWDAIDKNGDQIVCMKNRPHTPGNPAFFFNGVDNTAH